MKDTDALVATPSATSPNAVQGTSAGTTLVVGSASSLETELLRSPASGAPCVHWRLRIFEVVAPGVELVHEALAPEPFELCWRQGAVAPPRPVRIAPERARIQAQPTFHREGSPGARAVAQHFGLTGRVRVEEVLVRQGDALEAEGVLFDPDALAGGPYRGSHANAELFDVTVRLPSGLTLRPALLSWALGTAAALLGTVSAATALTKLWRFHKEIVAPLAGVVPVAEAGAAKVRRPRFP